MVTLTTPANKGEDTLALGTKFLAAVNGTALVASLLPHSHHSRNSYTHTQTLAHAHARSRITTSTHVTTRTRHVGGTIELFGQPKTNWLRLNKNAYKGNTTIVLESCVNWQAGTYTHIHTPHTHIRTRTPLCTHTHRTHNAKAHMHHASLSTHARSR